MFRQTNITNKWNINNKPKEDKTKALQTPKYNTNDVVAEISSRHYIFTDIFNVGAKPEI